MGRVTEQFNPDAASSSLQGGDLTKVKNTAGRRHSGAVTALEVVGGAAAVVTVLAGCDLIGTITAASDQTPTPSATKSPDGTPVEKPRWQTDESYAVSLFFKANTNNGVGMTAQEKTDWEAMTAGNNFKLGDEQFDYKDYRIFKERPTQGMILFTDTQIKPAPDSMMMKDGKMLTGTVDFGFFKNVNGVEVPYMIKIDLLSKQPDGEILTNIDQLNSPSDWDALGSFPVGKFQTAEQLQTWLQAHVGQEVIFGFGYMDASKSPNPSKAPNYTDFQGSKRLDEWLVGRAPRPSFVISNPDQLKTAPVADVLVINYSPFN